VDLVVFAALVTAFALLVTMHVALAVRLLLREPRWRGLVALILPPLAPYWGMEAGMKRMATLWVVALSIYVVARIAAAF
jgi:ABC-type uncharacterized transport system permease subunit